jgi:galactokinase
MRAEFAERFGTEPVLYRAPARVNLIGEHTDYNDGFVLPTATALYTWVAAAPRSDRLLKIFACRFDEHECIDLDRLEAGRTGRWADYARGVAAILEGEGHALRGADVVIDGEIPLGGGLSSSASLSCALAFALLDRSGIAIDRARLALLCQRVETDFAGVRCGIMDQYVIARAERDCAMLLDCRSLEFESIPIDANAGFVIVDSGVHHQLPAGEYNSRREECERAVSILAEKLSPLASLRDLAPEVLEEARGLLDDRLYRRCQHVLTENRRVRDAVAALTTGDVDRLGQLIDASHESLRSDFEVSCGELDALVEIATACPGVYGARMMGAGFGGCTINLVEPARVDQVVREISVEYGKILGREPWVHVVGSSDPVQAIA